MLEIVIRFFTRPGSQHVVVAHVAIPPNAYYAPIRSGVRDVACKAVLSTN